MNRIEITGYSKMRKSDIIYKKFIDDEMGAMIYAWEMKMQGYEITITKA